MSRIWGMGILVVFLAGAALADYSSTRTMELSAEGIDKLEISCGAGYLEVEGIEGMATIEVEAEIIIEGMKEKKAEAFVEENMELELEKHGKDARLTSRFEESGSLFGHMFSSGSKLINLTVRMPKAMALNIDDGSGSIWIQNIEGDLNIDDGSGEIEIENIVGDIEIDDGSGMVRMTNITGDIEISDGSGEINVHKVDGSVVISDGSGDIYVSDVTHDVEVIDDGSGRCRIRNVDGEVYEP